MGRGGTDELCRAATVNMKSYILVAFIVLVLAAFADADTDEQFSVDTIEIDFTVTMYQTVSQMGRWTDYDGKKSHYRNEVAKLLDIDPEQVSTTVTWIPDYTTQGSKIHEGWGRTKMRTSSRSSPPAMMLTVVAIPSNKADQTRYIIQGWIDNVSRLSTQLTPLTCTKVTFETSFRWDILSIVLIVLVGVVGIACFVLDAYWKIRR
jgi:hypothetical protein